MAEAEELIDVGNLIRDLSVEELISYAEEYFAQLTNWNYHLSKPFADASETPQLLINFAIVLQGLDLCPGLRVLEFGAGTCWASRFLSQMGCSVIATDVSATALRIGQELYERQPVIGQLPQPKFLPFNGRRLGLDDESVDRVICLDAFHHIANQQEVLNELSRVLVPGGIAGFSEPGPEHSQSTSSQLEMRKFKVIENDIHIHEIWKAAKSAGFTDIELAIFNIPAFRLSLVEFDDFLNGGKATSEFVRATRAFLQNQRTFFLFKQRNAIRDSRYRQGLKGEISTPQSARFSAGEVVKIPARVRNTSALVWLPRSAGLGAVHLGCHLRNEDGEMIKQSFHWESLTDGAGRKIRPGEAIDVLVEIPVLEKGKYVLEFDLVSNDVCWFENNGSELARTALEIS